VQFETTVPTVADRVAQTVVKMVLEPLVEPAFHQDSYGYRPGKSALEAVGVARKRCWAANWVIDLDIKAFFDSLSHDLRASRPPLSIALVRAGTGGVPAWRTRRSRTSCRHPPETS
jgi:retron-type reverse transcriptase